MLFFLFIEWSGGNFLKTPWDKNTDWAAFETDINNSLQLRQHTLIKRDVDNAIQYITRIIKKAIDKTKVPYKKKETRRGLFGSGMLGMTMVKKWHG